MTPEAAIQALAGMLTFGVTAVLVWITHRYLTATEAALTLNREQFDLLKSENERRDRVLLFLDLTFDELRLQLRVFNLGLSSVLVQKIVARAHDELLTPQTFDKHKIVESGKTETVRLPENFYDVDGVGKDFEFVIHYRGIKDSGTTPPKCFNVFAWTEGDEVIVTDGLDAFWYAQCPKCKVFMMTDVHDAKSFDLADARRKQAQEDMALSCPDHRSECFLTPEKVVEAQKARENRRKLPWRMPRL